MHTEHKQIIQFGKLFRFDFYWIHLKSSKKGERDRAKRLLLLRLLPDTALLGDDVTLSAPPERPIKVAH